MKAILLTSFVLASPLAQLAGSLIPDQYIVVFKPQVTMESIQNHFKWLEKVLTPVVPAHSLISFQQDQRNSDYFSMSGFWDAYGLIHSYSLPNFQGYSVRIPAFIVKLLQNHVDIAIIEQDTVMSINGAQQNTAAWGLIRISNRDHPEKSVKTYTYPDSAGTGVTAYIIDTGVMVNHPEFEGRARVGKSFSNDGTKDGNGHGTHVAGTIGSKSYGVAKNVSLVAVKVLDNQGSGSTSSVIAGIDWAAKDAKQRDGNGKRKSVANMSLGGGASAALDRAVKAATESGLVFAVAAGNSAGDACKLSPARVPEAITVAASDINDNIASFSERGKCVDVIAPGVDILSTWNNGKTNVISGTSMATPHVCGVVALALAEGSFDTVKQVHDYIALVSSKDRIKGQLRGTTNSFLYNNVLKGGFPDSEPQHPQPQPEEPEPQPPSGECPIPQCFFDPECTSCCVDCFFSL